MLPSQSYKSPLSLAYAEHFETGRIYSVAVVVL